MTRAPMTPIPKVPKAATTHLRRVDPKMERLISEAGRFRLNPCEPDLHLLCASVIGQSISMKAADKLVERFTARVGAPGKLQPKDVLRFSAEELKSIGLTTTKAGALRGLAELWQEKDWTTAKVQQVPDADLVEALTTVRGIGPWTAKMFLIFGLRRPDVLPHEDLGLREGLRRMHGLGERPDRRVTEALTEAWSPWRSVGTVYVWQHLNVSVAAAKA